MIAAYITCKDMEEAKKIALHLLAKKLIACGNAFPIKSWYNWEGKVQDDEEVVLLCKTADEKFDEIVKEVSAIHSYDVPCILKYSIEANEKYSEWVKDELSSR